MSLQGFSVDDEGSEVVGILNFWFKNQLFWGRVLNCQFMTCEGNELDVLGTAWTSVPNMNFSGLG